MFLLSACYFQGKSLQEILNKPNQPEKTVQNAPLQSADSVVVCRAKQCAPANISMSKEYIYNSLLQLFENNNKSTALICQASPNSHTCLENYITVPITVGITPAYLYIDSVKISDLTVGKNANKLNLLLNYNVTFNGQSPECTTSNTLVFAKSVNHIILEDAGYMCKMTTLGKTTIKTVFIIDYIDLDYGFIGGYYSLGLSGPAYGGGTGYMMFRLSKDAYPLNPNLLAPKKKANNPAKSATLKASPADTGDMEVVEEVSVEVFPIKK